MQAVCLALLRVFLDNFLKRSNPLVVVVIVVVIVVVVVLCSLSHTV